MQCDNVLKVKKRINANNKKGKSKLVWQEKKKYVKILNAKN